MLCERAQELFSDYHEGAVRAAMLVPLEGHLDQCEECRTKLDGMRDVWTMLDRAPVLEPPPDFRAVVWARIDAMEAEKARKKKPLFAVDWRSLFRPATLGWATAVLAVVLLAPTVIPGTRQAAGLWFPWSLIYSSASAATVTVGEPDVTIEDGKKWIVVQVNNTGASAARVEVKVDSAAAPAVIDAPAGSNQSYRVAEAPEGITKLRATWQEGGSTRTKDLTISQ